MLWTPSCIIFGRLSGRIGNSDFDMSWHMLEAIDNGLSGVSDIDGNMIPKETVDVKTSNK